MKYLLIVPCFLALVALSAQNLKFPDSARLSPDDYEQLHLMLYSNKQHFEEKTCPVKKIPLKLDAYLQEHTINNDAVQEILEQEDEALTFETYLDLGGIKIELGFMLRMIIPDYRPVIEPILSVRPLMKLEVQSWMLTTTDNDFEMPVLPLELTGENIFSNRYRFKNGLDNEKKLIISNKYFLDDKDLLAMKANFRGSITANALYLKNYNQIEVSKETIGDTVTIGEQLIVIVDVINNTMVYEKLGEDKGTHLTRSPNLSLVNADFNKENIIEATTEGPNSTIVINNSFIHQGCESKGSSSGTEVPVLVYEFFAKNPTGSLEEFKRSFDFSDEQFDLKSLEKGYSTWTISTPIEKLIFYSPNYEKLKSYEVAIGEGENNFGHLMSETIIEVDGYTIKTSRN